MVRVAVGAEYKVRVQRFGGKRRRIVAAGAVLAQKVAQNGVDADDRFLALKDEPALSHIPDGELFRRQMGGGELV